MAKPSPKPSLPRAKRRKPFALAEAKSPASERSALKKVVSVGVGLKALSTLPDDTFITDLECEMITRLSRTSLWRIEHGLDRSGKQAFEPEPLLKSYHLGRKRKVRRLGDLREFVRRRLEASTPAAA